MSEHCLTSGDEVLAFSHHELDISDYEQVNSKILSHKPDAVVNCAAWTNVDACEDDPKRAHAANALGPENLAHSCRKVDAVLLTVSTDYVFDGTKEGFYTQRDNPNPLSVYAASKLSGEHRAQTAHARTIVVRTGYIFGRGGTNFLSTMVDRALRGEELKLISDSWGTATYAPHLARRLRELIVKDLPATFHVVNAGNGVSYDEFAKVALKIANCTTAKLKVVSSDSLKRPAARPRNSRLKCLLSEAIGLKPLPSWEEGLREFLQTPDKSAVGHRK
ncbi:MAG: dTDP-4-dehydrorhamnose reductase [Blastocatellia bacterium]|nr:MAG: dTDP-4-dehydrorhamnose reductase [Blastocatellia bacterium]